MFICYYLPLLHEKAPNLIAQTGALHTYLHYHNIISQTCIVGKLSFFNNFFNSLGNCCSVVSQFFPNSGENEVRMLSGQHAVLGAVTAEKTLAGHTAAGEGFKRQIGLPPHTGAGGVETGVEQDFDTMAIPE